MPSAFASRDVVTGVSTILRLVVLRVTRCSSAEFSSPLEAAGLTTASPGVVGLLGMTLEYRNW